VKFHPLTNLFPLISKDELSRLADDIKERGFDQPIVDLRGQDSGRAQPMAGVPPGGT
jgi:ParB-like chromosome segregation protein Spo0J